MTIMLKMEEWTNELITVLIQNLSQRPACIWPVALIGSMLNFSACTIYNPTLDKKWQQNSWDKLQNMHNTIYKS